MNLSAFQSVIFLIKWCRHKAHLICHWTAQYYSLSRTAVQIAILDLSKAISRKRYKIGGKLLLMTNRKSHMRFRLVPKSVTLNDLERRNGHFFVLMYDVVVKQLPRFQNLLLGDSLCDARDICTLSKTCHK